MAKTTVGGANGLIDRLLTLMGWAASSNTADQQRKEALNALDLCEKMISQVNGLSYRRVYSQIVLNVGELKVAVPADMDVGMDITIEHPAGHGKVSVLPPDKFAAEPSTLPFDRIDQTPTKVMFAIDPSDGAMKFFFRRTNTGAGNLAYPVTYQQIVVNLVDATNGAGSTSLLPEGYELTLLLTAAEEFLKSRKTYPDLTSLTPGLAGRIVSFYDKYRTNKDEPVTDTNKARRKTEVDEMQTVSR